MLKRRWWRWSPIRNWSVHHSFVVLVAESLLGICLEQLCWWIFPVAVLSWDRAVSDPDLCCPVGIVCDEEGKVGERVESSLSSV